MFYSQFILAKKGPLGTIWIAAHLERKLRKNQVADTDIGVSVDSILFPDVPIALRLSSHLLLGVVRIYSRKVNYLFDDCSEALLKIKQAFRSTAVDLPPEESTAPYHSITLPETFDLDDFELPDNENFQGNYVDHHVSTKEQITLQDTMEGVIYSTSQFGLDERFGDGDTSQIGLDLDEELLLSNVVAPRHDGGSDTSSIEGPSSKLLSLWPRQGALRPKGVKNCNPGDQHMSIQSVTLMSKDVSHEGITEASEVMPVNGSGNQVVGLATDTEMLEYAQAPSTPGLLEEPDLSNVQEALACDDHMESEDRNLTGLVAGASTVNAGQRLDHHPGDNNTANLSSCNEFNPNTVEENGSIRGDLEIKHVKQQGFVPPTLSSMECTAEDNCLSNSLPSSNPADQSKPICPVSECSDGAIGMLNGLDRAEDIHNGVVIDNEPSTPFVHQTDLKSTGARLDETVASPGCSHVTCDFEDPVRRTFSSSTGALESKGYLEDDQASSRPEILNDVEIDNDVGVLCSHNKASVPNAVCTLESPEHPEVVNVEARACQEPKENETYNPVAHKVTLSNQSHVLQACNSRLSEPNMSSLGGDERLPNDVTDVGLKQNQISEPTSHGEIQAGSRMLDEQLGNAGFDESWLNNLNSSGTSNFPAPEKMLSLPEGLTGKPNDFLVESTPDKEALPGSDGAGAGIKIISGKKRSFTESTLTVQSLNSVESFGMTRSKRTAESIPDDDDLLSSILVGRRSSVLKMKPTPPVPETVSTKHPRSAPRSTVLKRKVLMDDTMVLHGDTIRQQLTNTEDIRRVRKKAPCTPPEISTILRQFLEDKIFSEPIFTGMSAGLIFLHSETFDLSRTKVSENDQGNASSEVAKDMESSVGPKVAEESEMNESTGPVGVRSDLEAQPADTSIHTLTHQVKFYDFGSRDIDSQGQIKAVSDVLGLKSSRDEPLGEITEMGIERGSDEVAEAVNSSIDPVSGDICNVTADLAVQPTLVDKTNDPSAYLPKDVSSMSPNEKLDSQTVGGDASMEDISNGKAVNSLEIIQGDVGIGADVQSHCLKPADGDKASLASECNILGFENGTQTLEETEHNKNEDVVLPAEFGCEEKDPLTCSGEIKIDSMDSVELQLDVSNASLNDKENLNCLESDPQSIMDGEIPALDHPGVEDHRVFEDATVDNDTEFLNVDDNEVTEEYDESMPCSEETRLVENSGWSSRTRAVAKYLQTSFDKQAVQGRKALTMDNLLAGKTRKEASRMFFETLVLKTRDYIHVEQAKPFDNVNIKPRVKLMKSDF
ncbi:sister chromatid cohesion 1 protein 4-like isoform X1 [Carya illinoinensis]|uniref:sister chromatid cohesion 1 protein 4-like isoform X1 n=1 Tax=Carya illinoinensis TaxID=32201 RepID=UPI001C717FAA|nr:sister chromatid cohesion 1 protein 4-like isoform X1 [Carya illinoinensis]